MKRTRDEHSVGGERGTGKGVKDDNKVEREVQLGPEKMNEGKRLDSRESERKEDVRERDKRLTFASLTS